MISSPLIDVVYLFGCMLLDLTYSILLLKDAKLKGYLQSYMHVTLINALEDNAPFSHWLS